MNKFDISKNAITSNGSSYSNYIYTFTIPQSDDGSDPLCLLPYQIETNKAFQEYLDGSENILERFKNALKLEENYITIMNMCVISLAQRTLDDIEDLVLKAKINSKGETHHIILLVEFYLLIHDDEKAIKLLIELFIKKEQQDVVLALLKEAFSRKMYSIEHLSKFVQDNCILVELIKINKQCFIQYHSQVSSNSFQTKQSIELNQDFIKILKQQSESQNISIKEQLSQQINNTESYQTQQTDQLSFISQKQDDNIYFSNISQLDFSFIEIVHNNPNLFSFQFRLPYMIGSYDIKRINKLQAKIAEGGFGEVYIAKHLKTNEIHALKIIKQKEDLSVNLILQEIIIQDKIQKLNPQLFLNLKPLIYLKKVSTLVDIFIPLELGQFSLQEYIQEHKIDEQEYNQFQNLFIDYIVTLHSNQYAHRDIKPQNILYIKDVGWKLADFGESVKYDDVEDIYKIRGTISFLPFRVRQQCNQLQQIKQNLLYNDLYAVVCTLVMIKNPRFNSQDLIYYMDNTQLDYQLQSLLQNIDNLEQLDKFKVPQLQQIETRVIIKKYILDQECQWDYYQKLRFYQEQRQQLDDDFIKQLDELLDSYREKQQKHNLIHLSILLSTFFPFQIEKFENIIVFHFQRHLLAVFQSIHVASYSYFLKIIDYFQLIGLNDLAINLCDIFMRQKYNTTFHLTKIQALIHLDQQKEAKEELELIYRYFISTQSYSLQEQILFFNLYLILHKQAPQIKVDKIFKYDLIQGRNKTESNYHLIKTRLNSPANMEIDNQKQHLKLRLDVLFEFISQDPYNVNECQCQEAVIHFGSQFLEDGQLVNCEELIQLIKENLIFWSYEYFTKTHIIAIGLNYVFNYYGKYQFALQIGQYFHKILRNIGSCEAILDHYEHLLNTQIIVYQLFNQKPANLIDLLRFFEEVQYLTVFDQRYINLKAMTIWFLIDKISDQYLNSQEVFDLFKQQIVTGLNQLQTYFSEKGINCNQRKKLTQFLTYMIINFLDTKENRLNQMKIVKKLFRTIQDINRYYDTFIGQYSMALIQTKQYQLNLNFLKLCRMYYYYGITQSKRLGNLCYQNLINIYLSPIKVLNILCNYGLNKKQSLFASFGQINFNNDLRYYLCCHNESRSTRLSFILKSKMDQINIKEQYLNL